MLFYFLLLSTILLIDAEKQCPRNSMYFDFEPCDPSRRSQCPSGFTCRRSMDLERPDLELFLCCESADMTAGEWFAEAMIAPQVFPQAPLSIIKVLKLQSLDNNNEFPPVHVGDEVVVITFPNYVTGVLQNVELNQNFMTTGYYHVMTIVDPGYRPFAFFFNYNIPCSQSPVINLFPNAGSQTNSMQRFLTYMDNTTTVPMLESYRAMYVVLVFRTNNPLFIQQQYGYNDFSYLTGAVLMGNCTDITCLLTNTMFGREIGQPISGSIFYMTTKRSMFPMSEQQFRDKAGSISGYFIIFLFAYLQLI